jgi:sugar lactone lactonase YvrE
MDVWMDGIVFGESPRWHDGRLWFSDWGAGRIWSVGDGAGGDGPGGAKPVIEAEVDQLMCIDFLPDGRLLVVSSADGGVLLRREADGSLVAHADLSVVTQVGWNDIVADEHGRAYVNSIAFEFPGGEFRPGLVVLVGADGSVRTVAEGLAFPNGMAISPDGSTLVVAESYGERVTAYEITDDGSLGEARTWAETPGDHPDGICFDASGALWYADVANQRLRPAPRGR